MSGTVGDVNHVPQIAHAQALANATLDALMELSCTKELAELLVPKEHTSMELLASIVLPTVTIAMLVAVVHVRQATTFTAEPV